MAAYGIQLKQGQMARTKKMGTNWQIEAKYAGHVT